MAFIRKRISSKNRVTGEKYSYQLIETYRDGGKVKQRILYNMGPSPTVNTALEVQHKALADYQKSLDRYLENRKKPYSERCYLAVSDAHADSWVEIYRRRVERTERNIAFLKSIVVSNENQFLSDITSGVYQDRLTHLSKYYDRLGVCRVPSAIKEFGL